MLSTKPPPPPNVGVTVRSSEGIGLFTPCGAAINDPVKKSVTNNKLLNTLNSAPMSVPLGFPLPEQ